jgi:uncharacterized protein DUF2784
MGHSTHRHWYRWGGPAVNATRAQAAMAGKTPFTTEPPEGSSIKDSCEMGMHKREQRYKFWADVVIAVHVVWTVIIFAGAVLVFFEPWYALFQIIVIGFTLLIALPFGGVCPLTLLEEWLRKKVDPHYTNHGAYLMTAINTIGKTHFSKRAVDTGIAIFYVISIAISILFLIKK